MQCSRCGFHNLPGTAECLSCRVPLGRYGAVVAVLTPPRAPAWRKRLRAMVPRLRLRELTTPRARTLTGALPCLLPGLPQRLAGLHGVSAVVLGAWLCLLLLAFSWLGTATGTVLTGLALSLHVASALLPFREALVELPLFHRCMTSLLVWGGLLLLVYVPLWFAVDHFVFPLRIAAGVNTPQIHGGDVVLVRRNHEEGWRPEAGGLVAFRHPWGMIVMDRVLGVGGDRIETRDRTWWRNGVAIPTDRLPLVPHSAPEGIQVDVPAGSVFIWPSLGLRVYNPANEMLNAVGIVPLRSLMGEPWWIWQPFSRRRPLEP